MNFGMFLLESQQDQGQEARSLVDQIEDLLDKIHEYQLFRSRDTFVVWGAIDRLEPLLDRLPKLVANVRAIIKHNPSYAKFPHYAELHAMSDYGTKLSNEIRQVDLDGAIRQQRQLRQPISDHAQDIWDQLDALVAQLDRFVVE